MSPASQLGWRKPILDHFTPEIAAATRLTVVADPDYLLTEEQILDALRARGFDLVPFDDPITFRFAYESKYRQVWDRGEATNLVVVLRPPRNDVDGLPYDLLEQARAQGRCLPFTIGTLFPLLAPGVVSELERTDFDALYDAQGLLDGSVLGTDRTKDFILLHVFEVVPDLIKQPSDLLRMLLRRHYRRQKFPNTLDDRLVHLLKQSGRWDDWPIDMVVRSRAAFLEFLEERWPIFLQAEARSESSGAISEDSPTYGLRIPGPEQLPFGHDDVKVYIDNLFQEGGIVATDRVRQQDVSDPWMLVGVIGDDGDDRVERFTRLLARLEKEIPATDAPNRAWVEYAYMWAEWLALRWDLGSSTPKTSQDAAEALHDRIEKTFGDWMLAHFGSLYNLSFVHRPVMVHHIAHHMAHHFTPTGAGAAGAGPPKRHALIVVDGLALDQWVVVRDALTEQLGGKARIEEDASFAWVPTLTSVSRQSIFAGEMPIYFEKSIGSTHKEKALWGKFWEEHGAKQREVGYVKQGSQESGDSLFQNIRAVSEHPATRMLGLVVSTVDQTMHGIVTGSSGLHSVVRNWAQNGAFARLLQTLLDDRYEIIITADHGNITGHGIGKPKVGEIADERGERAHVFPDELTRERVLGEFPDSIAWPTIGLPESYNALLAQGRGAFIRKSTTAVGHGGIAMEEVIVPFVKITGVAE